MQSSIFAKWAQGRKFDSHVILPAVLSLLLMGMYFSGNVWLRNIVAPTMGNMPLFSAREFGAPDRRPFDVLDALRTPYRIDIYQTVYFSLESFDILFELAQMDLIPLVKQARKMGMHAPTYPLKATA
jgi:hypothetical protein